MYTFKEPRNRFLGSLNVCNSGSGVKSQLRMITYSIKTGRETSKDTNMASQGKKVFAVPYRTVHFLSCVFSESIQCWSSKNAKLDISFETMGSVSHSIHQGFQTPVVAFSVQSVTAV